MARRSKFSKKLSTRGGFIPASLIGRAQAHAYKYATSKGVPGFIAKPALTYLGNTAYKLGKGSSPKFSLPSSLGKAAKKMFQTGFSPAKTLHSAKFIATTTKPSYSNFIFGEEMSANTLAIKDDYTKVVLNLLSSTDHLSVTGSQNTSSVGHGRLADLTSFFSTMKLSGVTGATGTTNITPQALKLYVGSYRGFLDIRSSTNNTVHMKIQDVAVRRDSQDTNGADPVSLSPLNSWAAIASQDFSVDFPAGYTNMTANTVGCSPVQSDLFNCYYQILATHEVDLLPGASHTHSYVYNVNKTLYNAMVAPTVSLTDANFRDFTFFSLITTFGDVVHDQADPTIISYGPTAVDIIKREKQTIFYIPYDADLELTQGLANAPAPESYTTLEVGDVTITTD